MNKTTSVYYYDEYEKDPAHFMRIAEEEGLVEIIDKDTGEIRVVIDRRTSNPVNTDDELLSDSEVTNLVTKINAIHQNTNVTIGYVLVVLGTMFLYQVETDKDWIINWLYTAAAMLVFFKASFCFIDSKK